MEQILERINIEIESLTSSEKYCQNQNKVESNARTYSRIIDKLIVSGKGSLVYDAEGLEYIDLLACAGTLALGHRDSEITQVLKEYLDTDQIMQGLDILTPAKYAFTQQLFSMLPASLKNKMKIQFCGPTGADATEAAIKLLKIATKRRTVFAFHGGYHGMTAGSLALTGNLAAKNDNASLMPDVHFFPFPYDYRSPYKVTGDALIEVSLNHIESVLSDPESGITKPAAIILEAIQGEGGCVPAPKKWLQGLREICTKYDIPLVLDEVQTGFGRTGDMFAFEYAGIEPDVILMSKAIGGGLPMSVILYKEQYDKWEPGSHAGTFRGNQMAMISGRKVMEIIKRDNLCSVALEQGEYLKQKLLDLQQKCPIIGDVRGRGLMLGIEIIAPNPIFDPNLNLSASTPADGALASKIKKACFKEGLIIETGGRYGSVLRFLPALTVSKAELSKAVSILEYCIKRILES